jgi:hypothetical protein
MKLKTQTTRRNWHGSITREAIAEALELAGRALFDHLEEYGK